MYWLGRPPYLRYAAAALVLVGAAWFEFRQPALVLHPYATDAVPSGTALSGAAVEWRQVPAGLLPPIDPDGVIRRRLEPGSPVLPADVGLAGPIAPAGWWGIEIPLPARAQAGQEVQLVVLADPARSVRTVPGVVLEPNGGTETLGFTELPGLVAVPPSDAVLVAVAVAEGRLSVLVEP